MIKLKSLDDLFVGSLINIRNFYHTEAWSSGLVTARIFVTQHDVNSYKNGTGMGVQDYDFSSENEAYEVVQFYVANRFYIVGVELLKSWIDANEVRILR